MKHVTRVLLVGRHKIMTDGLHALFEREVEFKVVGQSADGPAAIDPIVRLKPAVVVVDVLMQSLDGLVAIRELKRRAAETRIVALSMCTDVPYVSQALNYGVSAYVLKSDSFGDLARAVREVVSGRQYLSRSLDHRAIKECRRKSRGELVDKFFTLTHRERQVFQLSVEGCTSTQIATRLGIGRRTAETHRSNIYRKLQIQSHADLIALALRRGLIAADRWFAGQKSDAVRPGT
jgi:DNA-binding NarL/FixJ family response regulator